MMSVAGKSPLALSVLVSFDDIQRETVLELHAGGAKDGAQRASRPTLFADHLANVVVGDMKAKNDGILIADDFDPNRVDIVNQGSCDLSHQSLHLRDS